MSVTQFSCSLKLTGAQTLSQHVSACQCWAIFSLYYKNCIERVNIYVTFWHWNHSIKQCCVLRHFWHESVNAKVVTISICQITVSLSSTMAAHVTWSFPPRQRHCLVVLLKILWTGTEFPVSRRKPLFPLYIYINFIFLFPFVDNTVLLMVPVVYCMNCRRVSEFFPVNFWPAGLISDCCMVERYSINEGLWIVQNYKDYEIFKWLLTH